MSTAGSDSETIAESSDDDTTGEDRTTAYIVGSLVAGVFFGGLSGGVAFPTLPALGPVLGISPLMVGVILSLNRFTRLLMNTPAGHILDGVGTRQPMIFGFFLQGLTPFGYILGLHPGPIPLGSTTIFLISRACWGIGSAFVFVGAFTIITHVTTEDNRGRWIGYMRGGQAMGFPSGLVVGGVISDVYGFTEAFAIAGIFGVLAGIVAFLVLPNVTGTVENVSRLREVPHLVMADRRIFAISTVNFLVRFLFAGVLLATIVVYAQTYEISLAGLGGIGASGFIMAFAVLSSGSTTVFVGRYSDGISNRALVTLPALVLLGSGFFLLATLPLTPSVFLGVALIGIGVGGTNPPLLAYLGDISPPGDVGKIGGAYNVFGDLGGTLGPVIALPLVAEVGFTASYLACVMLTVLAAGLIVNALLDTPSTLARAAGE